MKRNVRPTFSVALVITCGMINALAGVAWGSRAEGYAAWESNSIEQQIDFERRFAPGAFPEPEESTESERTFFGRESSVLEAFSTGSAVPWNQIINSNGGAAVTFGVQIQGPQPYARNEVRNFFPASNSKLFTSAAALDQLGSDFRYETRLEWSWVGPIENGDATSVELIGSGDPSWGLAAGPDSHLEITLREKMQWFADRLWAAGVRTIHGPIIVTSTDARWDKSVVHPEGWSQGDWTVCYGALAQKINFGINCAYYTVTSTRTGAWEDPDIDQQVTVAMTAGSSTVPWVSPITVSGVEAGAYKVGGTWGGAKSAVLLPVHQMSNWAKNALTRVLLAKGVRVLPNQTLIGQTDPSSEVPPAEIQKQSISYFSAPLSEIIRPFMKQSLNVVGDALLKTIGSRLSEPEPSENLLMAGVKALELHVSKIGLPSAAQRGVQVIPGAYANAVKIKDGSGLSRASLVTPEALLVSLQDNTVAPWFNSLWNSLPIAGTDGTLRNRMKNTPAQGVLRGKTGTLTGVYNLSGFVPSKADSEGGCEYVPFVMLTSTTGALATTARSAQDRVGSMLAKTIRN